jgi:HPt (histidine-containing phosphotransfer) domain-containing protein
MVSSAESDLQTVIVQARADFVRQLGGTLDSAAHLWSEWKASGGNREPLDRLVHRLAGAAGTFGLGTISRLARTIEVLLSTMASHQQSAETLQAIDLAFEKLDREGRAEAERLHQHGT